MKNYFVFFTYFDILQSILQVISESKQSKHIDAKTSREHFSIWIGFRRCWVIRPNGYQHKLQFKSYKTGNGSAV